MWRCQFFRRAQTIGFSINDYAERLANTETETARMRESLLAAQKLQDWSRMSAAMSHEISNPIETIQNLLYLIGSTEGVPAAAAAYANQAREEAESDPDDFAINVGVLPRDDAGGGREPARGS